jgi:hypothetical protein
VNGDWLNKTYVYIAILIQTLPLETVAAQARRSGFAPAAQSVLRQEHSLANPNSAQTMAAPFDLS